MKRLAIAILVLVMVSGMVACAEAEGLNLLWDIPFGVSPEEMVHKTLKKAGVSLVVSSYSGTNYEIDDKQKVSIIGCPVDSMNVSFRDKVVNEDGGETSIQPPALSSIYINFEDHSSVSDGLEELRNINKALRDKYGEPSYAYFEIMKGSDEGTRKCYEIPLSDDKPVDLSPFILLPDEYDITFVFVYKNVRAGGGFSSNNRTLWDNWVSFSDSIIEKPKFTPHKIGEKKELDSDKLPTPEPAVDTGF